MPTTSLSLDELKRQRAELDQRIAQGTLSGDEAAEARAKIEKAIVDAVMAGPVTPGAPPQAAAPAPSRALLIGITVFVLAFGVFGYAWRGNFAGLAVGPGDRGPVAAGEGAGGHEVSDKQIEDMLAKLAARLKERPDDADGWAMLGRSYTALNRPAEALAAYRKVVELRPKDAQALADLADGLAVANNRSLDGEPERLIQEAVRLDPRNVKAQALAGTVAFNRSDFKTAADHWQKAVDASEPGSEFARQLQTAVDEARSRAGTGAAAAPATADARPTVPAAAGAGAVVAGRVTLGKALQAQVAPGDTLFIFARASAGPKVPLAILRKTAGDLPVDFTLDDSLAMSPAAKLSTASQVVVGARVSKSGNAMPQPGDLQVLSAPVAVGTKGITLEINDVVR